VRAFSAVALVAGLVFLTACGGSGTPAGVPITITLSASLTSLNPGQASTITATVVNDSSNKGVSWSVSPTGFGALSNQTATSVTYTAPASVPTTRTVTITATSVASSTVTATVQIAVQTSSITVSLSPSTPQTINEGTQLGISATVTNASNKNVTWSLTPSSGAGMLSSQGPSTSVTYVAPSTVTGSVTATLTATTVATPAATASLKITVLPSGAGSNVAALTVDAGPVPTTNPAANTAYVSVTICVPGTQTCQTVDHIEVDTGSSGLRILQSVIPGLALPTLGDGSGGTIYNCVQFLDTSYLWGPVQQAEVEIAGEVAGSSTPLYIQTISSSNTGVPTACSNGGTVNENTPQLLEANGILGVGLEPTDCFAQGLVNLCDGSVQSPIPAYFDCPSSGCASNATQITIDASHQVTNPVTLFADNNGVIVELPPVTSAAATVSGSLIFGINTQANNTLGTATAFPLSNDSFTTDYSNQTLTDSFIDSGSNALFFPSSITACTDNSFYCPASLTPQSATNVGAGGSPTSIVPFDVDNADNLFNNNPGDAAFGTLAGPQGTPNTCTSGGTGSCSFDWGLPFFYGRSVFTAIDGATVTNVGTGPFWAY
jgi:Protein of unknown function (DUF3443)